MTSRGTLPTLAARRGRTALARELIRCPDEVDAKRARERLALAGSHHLLVGQLPPERDERHVEAGARAEILESQLCALPSVTKLAREGTCHPTKLHNM